MGEKDRYAVGTEDKPWLESVAVEPTRRPWSVWGVRSKFVAIVAVLVLLAFGIFVWSVYGDEDAGAPPPLVAAPSEPFRVAPEDSGGMDVPHRDKLVFNRVSGHEAAGEARLAEAPETPMPRPEVPTLTAASQVPAEVVGTDEEAAEPQPPTEVLPRDAWAIQVAAFQQRRDARAWMVRTKYGHEEVFGGLQSEVLETRRDMRTYYRVRFGPFPDRVAARAKCAEVRAIGLNCIVIVPDE